MSRGLPGFPCSSDQFFNNLTIKAKTDGKIFSIENSDGKEELDFSIEKSGKSLLSGSRLNFEYAILDKIISDNVIIHLTDLNLERNINRNFSYLIYGNLIGSYKSLKLDGNITIYGNIEGFTEIYATKGIYCTGNIKNTNIINVGDENNIGDLYVSGEVLVTDSITSTGKIYVGGNLETKSIVKSSEINVEKNMLVTNSITSTGKIYVGGNLETDSTVKASEINIGKDISAYKISTKIDGIFGNINIGGKIKMVPNPDYNYIDCKNLSVNIIDLSDIDKRLYINALGNIDIFEYISITDSSVLCDITACNLFIKEIKDSDASFKNIKLIVAGTFTIPMKIDDGFSDDSKIGIVISKPDSTLNSNLHLHLKVFQV